MWIGAIGGFGRRWWLTVLLWSMLLVVYVWHDVETNPFGYRSLYATYVLNQPPQGFMYWHSWEQLYEVTIIPLTLAVAVLTQVWIAERRRRRDEARASLPEPAILKRFGDTAIQPEPSAAAIRPRGTRFSE
jgi:hypothetical protein